MVTAPEAKTTVEITFASMPDLLEIKARLDSDGKVENDNYSIDGLKIIIVTTQADVVVT